VVGQLDSGWWWGGEGGGTMVAGGRAGGGRGGAMPWCHPPTLAHIGFQPTSHHVVYHLHSGCWMEWVVLCYGCKMMG
jgi:hypothetical protein